MRSYVKTVNKWSGTVDIATVKDTRDNYAIGLTMVDEEIIIITHGQNYRGMQCLVRFDTKQNEGSIPKSNFLTNNIPNGFSRLDYNKYIMFALWIRNSMRSSRPIPTLDEINQYYDPGHTPWVTYLKEGSGPEQGRIKIDRYGLGNQKGTIQRIITERMPDPSRAARLFLYERDKEFESARDEVVQMGLVPIILEPLIR